MNRLKRFLQTVCVLPIPLTILIAVPLFVLVFLVLLFRVDGPLSYCAYVGAGYALLITVTGLPRIFRSLRQKIKTNGILKKITETPIGQTLTKDPMARTTLSLYSGSFINLLFVVLKLGAGIYYRSLWLITIGVYYSLLVIMRLLLIRCVHKRHRTLVREWQRYRLCGILLLLMNQALAGIVLLIVQQNQGYNYPGTLVYIMAIYAFYAVITAIVSLVRFRNYGSPVLQAAKAINLVAAMMSILALETAMITQFGSQTEPQFRQIMTSVTGCFICGIVLCMAVFMIVKSTKYLNRIKQKGASTHE